MQTDDVKQKENKPKLWRKTEYKQQNQLFPFKL